MKIAVLAGGVGAARFLRGLLAAVPASTVTAIVNTGDDAELHGLAISPDLDTITYTLAEATDPERGWGLAGETWHAMGALARYAPGSPPAIICRRNLVQPRRSRPGDTLLPNGTPRRRRHAHRGHGRDQPRLGARALGGSDDR